MKTFKVGDRVMLRVCVLNRQYGEGDTYISMMPKLKFDGYKEEICVELAYKYSKGFYRLTNGYSYHSSMLELYCSNAD